jgi:hypothetical protein
MRHERPLLVKDGIGREMAGQFGLRFRLPRKSQESFTCRKSATWDRRLYFPSEGRHAVDFFARKIRRLLPSSNPRSYRMVIVHSTKYGSSKYGCLQNGARFCSALYVRRIYVLLFKKERHEEPPYCMGWAGKWWI